MPLSRGRDAVPHSPRLVTQYTPLFLAPVLALDSCSRPHTEPLLSFLLGHHP
jgi:hypothetical protein